MEVKDSYAVLGMMSGTSLDGLDIAYCYFERREHDWYFEVKNAETISYSKTWKDRLKEAVSFNAASLIQLDAVYGKYLGEEAKKFIDKYQLMNIDFISSHGHTVFHQPDRGFTLQIGSGWELALNSGYKVITDFRSKDIALGGQGAPLVPIGDQLLFREYDFCLNLGGIANISLMWEGSCLAYDICPANMLLNYLVKDLGLEYDQDGQLASHGNVDQDLLNQLDNLEYYGLTPPKSTGWEWFEDQIVPILLSNSQNPQDKLNTSVVHIVRKIADDISSYTQKAKSYTLLVSGGGAKNTFLIKELRKNLSSNINLIVPQQNIIDFKEALIFAFLGVLRDRGDINCLSSVTGCSRDHSSGLIFIP